MALVALPVTAQDRTVRAGDCSAQIVNSTVGDVLLICDRYRAILTDLVQEIQKTARLRGYSQLEQARFVEGVNAVLGGFSRSLSALADAPKPNGAEFERKRIRVVLQLAAVFDRLIGASAGDAAQFRLLAQNWRDQYAALVAELDGKLPEDRFVRDALANEQDLDLAVNVLNTLLARQDTRLDAMALRNHQLGKVLLLKFEAAKALPFFLRAHQLMPASFEYARSYGVELFKADRFADCIAPLRQAITNFNELPADQRPSNSALAQVRLTTGAAYAKLGRDKDAEVALRAAVALSSTAPAADMPAMATTADALVVLAGVHAGKGELDLSAAALAEAGDLVAPNLQRDFLRFQPLMRRILISQSLLDTTAGNNPLAEQRLRQAMALEQRATNESGARYAAGRAEVLHHLGAHYGSIGRHGEAADAAREAVAIHRRLRTAGGGSQHLREFASSLMLLARMIVRIDPARAAEAEVLATEATTLLAANLDSRDPASMEFLVAQTIELAEIQLMNGNHQAAELLASSGVKTYRMLTQLRMDKGDAAGLTRALQAAGNASSRLGRAQLADQHFTEAIAIARASGRSRGVYARRKYIELLRDAEKHYATTRRMDVAARLNAEIEELSPLLR